MNTTNNSMYNGEGFYLVDKSQISHLNNRHLNNALRISTHLIEQDIESTHHKLSLLALQRYYMIKYLKSIRTRIERDNKKSQRLYSLRVEALYSYVFRKLRSVVKYVCELSKIQKVVEFIRFPNVTIVHWDRLRNPHIFSVKRVKNVIRSIYNTIRIQIKRRKY